MSPYLDEVYDYALSPYRSLATNVLQIGEARSDAIGFWKTIFPKGKIFTVADGDPGAAVTMPYFSVIIVEGSLTTEAKVNAIKTYAGHVSPQGAMVIEGVDGPGVLAVLCDAASEARFPEATAWETARGGVTLVLK